jgi:hypothetical protein
VIELEDGDRSVEIERDVFELHGFLIALRSAMFRGPEFVCRSAYLIFAAGLSMVIRT